MSFVDVHIPRGRQGRVERFDAAPHRPWLGPPHQHRELELNIVTRGEATYIVGSKRCELRSGSLLWLFAGQPHILVETSPRFEMWLAVFRAGFVRQWGAAPLRQRGHIEAMCRSVPVQAYSALAAQARLLDDATMPENHHTLGLRWLLCEAWRQYSLAPSVPQVRSLHPAVAAAAQHLRRDPETPSLSDLALQLNIDLPRLSRTFHQQIGMTLTDFRSRQRLQRFLELISAGRRVNLMAAALAAGFQSYAQCFRDCRRLTGASPSSLASYDDE